MRQFTIPKSSTGSPTNTTPAHSTTPPTTATHSKPKPSSPKPHTTAQPPNTNSPNKPQPKNATNYSDAAQARIDHPHPSHTPTIDKAAQEATTAQIQVTTTATGTPTWTCHGFDNARHLLDELGARK
jgi:hypothetical protein